MFSFKRSLITIVGILVISVAVAMLIPFVISGQDKPLKRDPRRSFYLTQTTHNGGQPLTACAEGYHMASLWEIFDPSNLRYGTELGFIRNDSGFGPPSEMRGWIRTGFALSDDATAGQGNCNAWTTDVSSGDMAGTTVSLTFNWDDPAVAVSPWSPSLLGCGSSARVWCVQD